MRPQPFKPTLNSKKWDELPISNENLLLLMQDVLTKGAQFQFRAKGRSMSPFIKDGDVITISPITNEKPTTGKVVAFIRSVSGQLVVHRVVGRHGNAYLVQGDNVHDQAEGIIPSKQILGCVTRLTRNQRRVFWGLGPERYLIAFLSRSGLLRRLLHWLRAVKRFY